MKIELISVIGLLLCLLIIGIEYILHYRLAEIQDEHTARIDNIRRRLDVHVEGVLYAPTDSSRESEITALANEINGDYEVYEMSVAAIRNHKGTAVDNDAAAQDHLIGLIDDQVNPVEIYAKMLEDGNIYHKGYACRRLAEMNAQEYRDKIKDCLQTKNRDLAYNAAMALCHMGDVYEVVNYLLSIQDDRMYSGRIVNEFFAQYTGDRRQLASLLFEKCNRYMKCTIIKTLEPYRIDAFRPMYIEGASGNDNQLRIACVKALSAFGYPEDEQLLQIAAQDKDWVIRSAAVRGLSRLESPTALATVKHALSDKEWWVRQTAAQAITKMNILPSDLEEILGGYDRYAADAVKTVLYRAVDTE